MYDELYATPRAQSLGQMVQRPTAALPEPEPGTFAGFGGAVAVLIPHGFLTSASSWAPILDGFGMIGDPEAIRAAEGDPTKLAGLVEAGVDKDLREKAKQFAPDPASVGKAGQIIHSVGSTLTKAGAYALTTGPVAPVAFGADIGIGRTQELTDQGVDVKTASEAGLVSGVAAAVGYRLPAALGATRLQSAGIGAAVNPAVGVVERGSIHAILENADYDKIAAQYVAFDPLQLTIDAITGGAFGAMAHGAKAEGRAATPDEHAAALTANEVQTRDADTLTKPGDINAASQAAEAQQFARMQLDGGEQVSVAHGLRLDPEIAGQVREAVTQNLATSVDDLKATLGAMGRGISDGFYLKAFESLQAGKTTMSGVRESILVRAREAFDAGLIKSPEDLRFFEESQAEPSLRAVRPQPESGTLKVLAPEAAETAPRAAGKPGEGKEAETPEMKASRETIKADPEMVVTREDGTTAKAADLIKEADDLAKQAETEANGVRAAIACALRFGI